MKTVLILYDTMTEAVKVHITRDFLLLAGEFTGLAYLDPAGQVDQALMEKLGVERAPADTEPIMNLVYKVVDWPEVDEVVPTVKRDLSPQVNIQRVIQQDNNMGHPLKPQGRPGANLTERYLNRSYPKGRGVHNPLVLLLWS